MQLFSLFKATLKHVRTLKATPSIRLSQIAVKTFCCASASIHMKDTINYCNVSSSLTLMTNGEELSSDFLETQMAKGLVFGDELTSRLWCILGVETHLFVLVSKFTVSYFWNGCQGNVFWCLHSSLFFMMAETHQREKH